MRRQRFKITSLRRGGPFRFDGTLNWGFGLHWYDVDKARVFLIMVWLGPWVVEFYLTGPTPDHDVVYDDEE